MPEEETKEVITAPDKELKPREVAYTLSDKYFQDFEVEKSANAWWMDRRKVERLIESFKIGYNIIEACVFAGISIAQYKYFVQIHPEFSTVKERCEIVTGMLAESGNVELLNKKDGSQIRWFLERRKPEKYGKTQADNASPTLNNYGTIINTPVPRDQIDPLTLEILEAEEKENGK